MCTLDIMVQLEQKSDLVYSCSFCVTFLYMPSSNCGIGATHVR